MPWHVVPIEPRRCPDPRCTRVATVEVRNARNETIGFYCRDHAAELVARSEAEGW